MSVAPIPSPRDRANTHKRLREYGTARARAGRPFTPTAERALEPILRSLAAHLPRAARGVVVVPEMPGPAGVPDLVAVPSPDGLASRLACAVPPLLTWGEVLVAAAVPVARPVTPATIASRARQSEAYVRRRLGGLASVGAVVKTDASHYTRNPAIAPIGRIYALEAKIDNWSAGISQALRYGAWADASGAVLAQLPTDHSRAIEQAANLGVGLAVGTKWLVRPHIHPHALARRLWASEFVLAALEESEATVGRDSLPFE